MSDSELRSMTGFGRACVALDGGELSAEVRSVNSRHLDVRVRLPRDLAALEAEVRACASVHFARGQVEVAVRLPRDVEAAARLEIDVAAARSYAQAAEQLRGDAGVEGALDVSTLLALPGVSRLREPELDAGSVRGPVLLAVEQACEAAVEMRLREGSALERELRERLGAARERVERIAGGAGDVRLRQRERLLKRVAGLSPEIEVDPARLEQEVVLLVERMDITEETVRLTSHLDQFAEALATAGPVGRKLEFLLQEMGREVNTAGAKSSDTAIAREVVDLKVELEKVREQVLNVE